MNAQMQSSSGSPQPTATVQSGTDEQPVQQNFCTQELVDDILSSVKLLNCKSDPVNITKSLITNCSTKLTTTGSESPIIVDSQKSWLMNYSAMTFMMNGQLFAEYDRISNIIGLPQCSEKQWQRITQWLGEHVTALAEWSCEEVRKSIKDRGDNKQWTASFDGFYLTRGHYSNNSSTTLHDYATGSIAWYETY